MPGLLGVLYFPLLYPSSISALICSSLLPLALCSSTYNLVGRVVALPSASKHVGSRLSGVCRSARHEKPFVPPLIVTYPLRSNIQTVAIAEIPGGAALSANWIRAARG